MRFVSFAAPVLVAGTALLSACGGGDTTSSTTTTSGTSGTAGNAGNSGTAGNAGTGGAGASGGSAGSGGVMETPLTVGVGKQIINPTLVETEWDDKNADGYWDQPD